VDGRLGTSGATSAQHAAVSYALPRKAVSLCGLQQRSCSGRNDIQNTTLSKDTSPEGSAGLLMAMLGCLRLPRASGGYCQGAACDQRLCLHWQRRHYARTNTYHKRKTETGMGQSKIRGSRASLLARFYASKTCRLFESQTSCRIPFHVWPGVINKQVSHYA